MQASRQFLDYVAHTLGWRVAFLIVAALFGVWLTVPQGVKIAPLNGASWRRVLTRQALMTVLLVTVLNGRGQFTFFTYLAPSLKASLPDNAELLTLVLAYGTVATLGNVLVTRAVGRLGAPRSALFALLVSVWRFGGLGRSRGIIVGGAGGRDAVGPWYICRKFRSAGPVCRHCSRPAPRRPLRSTRRQSILGKRPVPVSGENSSRQE